MSSVVTIVQARMGSSRLPGKVLRPLGGQPALLRVLQRVWRSRFHGEAIVATSDLPQDDPIAAWCKLERVPCFRGSERDVLDRYYKCALMMGAEIVVRVTADCPLLDPQLLDCLIATHREEQADYVFCQGMPAGIGQETLSFSALERSWLEATQPEEREHVIYYVTEHPDLFRVLILDPPAELALPDWRLTLDTEADYRLFSQLFCLTDGEVMHMSAREIIELVRQCPSLLEIAQNRPS
jgi:spore coat polysaccharide biosynthesis protein SpsF